MMLRIYKKFKKNYLSYRLYDILTQVYVVKIDNLFDQNYRFL